MISRDSLVLAWDSIYGYVLSNTPVISSVKEYSGVEQSKIEEVELKGLFLDSRVDKNIMMEINGTKTLYLCYMNMQAI